MGKHSSNVSWMGIALVILGTMLLLTRLHVFHVQFWTLFWPIVMILSLRGVATGFSLNKRGKIFWGTVWFLYGLFFLLRNSDYFDIRPHMIVPATFLIVGIAFLMTYLNNIRDWFFLIPAVIAGLVGTLFLMAEYDYLSYWDVADSLHTYWPVILILFGIVFLLRRKKESPPPPPPVSQ